MYKFNNENFTDLCREANEKTLELDESSHYLTLLKLVRMRLKWDDPGEGVQNYGSESISRLMAIRKLVENHSEEPIRFEKIIERVLLKND